MAGKLALIAALLVVGCDMAPGHLWCHPTVAWLQANEGVGAIETCRCEGRWNMSSYRPCVVETRSVRYHVTCLRLHALSTRRACKPTWLGKNEDGQRWYQPLGEDNAQ